MVFQRTEIIAIFGENLRKSRFVSANFKNCDLSRRMGKIAILYVPRFPFELERLCFLVPIAWKNSKGG